MSNRMLGARAYREGYYCNFQSGEMRGAGFVFLGDFIMAYTPGRLAWSEKKVRLKQADAILGNRLAGYHPNPAEKVVKFSVSTLLLNNFRSALEKNDADEIYRIIEVLERGILASTERGQS